LSPNVNQVKSAICIAEDRLSEQHPLMLLILSLRRYAPRSYDILLHYPVADLEFEMWLSQFKAVRFIRHELDPPFSWNVKPTAILKALSMGYSRVVWIDSDVIVCRDISDLLDATPINTLVVSEEPRMMANWAGHGRTREWGFEVGNPVIATVNTGILSFSSDHLELLREWQSCLGSDRYVRAQSAPFECRPYYLQSDQDVLTALIGSKKFAGIEIKYLRSGRDVIQSVAPASYPLFFRIQHVISGWPYFIHAMRRKPWRLSRTPRIWQLQCYYDALHCEISPYTSAATRLASNHFLPWPWLTRRTMVGLLLKASGLFLPPLYGLPLSAVDSYARLLRRSYNRTLAYLKRGLDLRRS
jgi:hypothetical protein